MKIQQVKVTDVPGRSIFYKRSENRRILEEFADMDCECVEVKDFTNSSARYCVNSLNQSIKRFKMFNLRAVLRDERVFLHKKNV